MKWSSLNKKQSGFTLTELMIGMIVSGIVLSAIWLAFGIVQKLAVRSFASKNNLEEISLFKRSLSIEVEHAKNILATENGLVCSSGDESADIRYQFYSGYVLREQSSHTDTFHVAASKPELLNKEGTAAQSEEEVRTIQTTVQVNAISQEFILKKDYTWADQVRSDD